MRAELHEIPFMRLLGAELVRAVDGEAEIALALVEGHMNSWGVGHGGVVMSLLDVAMARAAKSRIEAERGTPVGSVTVEMKTSFFRPARGRVVARGRVLHRSTTMAYCEAELVDAEGALVAKALGTIKFLTRLDAADRL
ncbi:MAG: PaaI family thioesterase [Burkholderiaceae bacterium]